MAIRIIRRIKYSLTSLPAEYYQYSALGFLFWAAMAGTSFTTVYLQNLNFSALQIGSMNAAFMAINIVAPPFWGVISDKLRSVKKVFAICMIASMIVWFLLPHTVRWFSPLIVLIVLPIYRFTGTPTQTLLDGWMVRYVNNDRRVGFGAIRMWGSVGWTIIAVSYGFMLKTAPLDIVFYGYALFAVPCVILALFIKEFQTDAADGAPRRTLSLREMQLGRIIGNKPLIAYLVFNFILYTPIMAAFTFMPFLVEAAGGQSSFMGLISGGEALLEIPLLFFSARLIKRFKTTDLVIFCACLYTAEITLYSFCQSPWQVLFVHCIHGLGYGLYLSCMVQYVFRLAPKGLTATAQTMIACSNALAGIAGNLAGGAIINALGVRVFFRYSGIFMLLAVAAYILWLRLYGGGDGEGNGEDGGGFA